jgi:energy-coupling factor transport system permease protein
MLSDITIGQYYPGSSLIHKLDPRTKILGTLLFIIAIFLAVDYVGYLVLTAFVVGVILISRLPVGMVLRSLKPLLFIIVLTLALHIFMGKAVRSSGNGTLSVLPRKAWRWA